MHVCVREVALLLPRKLRRRPIAFACQRYGHERLTLPELDLDEEFPGFSSTPVQVRALPTHGWSSPLADQIAVTKIAKLTEARRILEVGSFEGHTALMLAENTTAEITTVDVLHDHGRVYRGRVNGRITRHVGTLENLDDRGPFDLIFLDADHRESEVRRDTALALPLLAPGGVFLWHDYCDSFWVDRLNRVPEVLADLSSSLPIRGIPCTKLAAYRS